MSIIANKMKNCPECGRVFVDAGAGLCNACLRKEEEYEIIVCSYLRDNPGSTIRQIYEATGIKERTLMRMIRLGRFLDAGEIKYPCERCGTLINEGKYCEKCGAALQNEIKKVTESLNKKMQNTAGKNGSETYSTIRKI